MRTHREISSPSGGKPQPGGLSSTRAALSLSALCLGALALFVLRPQSWHGSLRDARNTQSCLSNLSHIAQAFVQYAEDYDGKFPRGVDPEDRNDPRGWAQHAVPSPDGMGYHITDYSDDARTAPMLHEVLLPYTRDRSVWRCPADKGWSTRIRDENGLGSVWGRLRNVQPSSYAKFGTSYYYYTERGFAGWQPSELVDPSRSISVFDGDAWHSIDGQPSLNVLCADGHVQNMSLARFNEMSRRPSWQELRSHANPRNF
ncbi:MAG TPA: hypothetical protein VF600_14255 [Abditibacteriaceae bacterium]|jgi:hypothetical protein